MKIYHNPKCSKSRATLALLKERGLTPRIVEYLQSPPSIAELEAIVAMLGIRPEQLVRKGEGIYKSRYAGKTPIVVLGHRAVIGRPPETVLTLLRE